MGEVKMSKSYQYILNLAAGKIEPLELPKKYCLINLDTIYAHGVNLTRVEEMCRESNVGIKRIFCKEDAFEFMERVSFNFDRVVLYRFLEHISFTQVEYFIYLISTITSPGAVVDVIVPDYKILADMLMKDNPWKKNFHADNILLTTELLNEPSCPHASIWTRKRVVYFWELEERFKVDRATIETPVSFDNRDIYLRFKAVRI